MHEDFEYVESLEKEIDELESEKADFSNIYDLLLEECVSKDVICSYLHSLSDLNAHTGLQCLYLHKVKECECLAQKLSKQTESVNKEVHNNLLKSFSKLEKHSISLELALQQSISELKKLIEKCKGKSVETQFDKPSVVRQPNAQRIPKPSVLGKPTPFSNSPEMRSFQTKQSVNKTNVSDGLFNQVTLQNLPQNRKQAEIHSNEKLTLLGQLFTLARQGTSFNGQKQQRIDLNADALYNAKQENLRAPFLNVQRRLIAADQASVFMAMTFEQRSSSLVLHQMTSDHNRSELGIQDHSNEQSSSKLVPKVVPLAVKTATSRQELELLFHHHIAMLRTTEHPSDTNVFTMKMEILLEPASNKLLVVKDDIFDPEGDIVLIEKLLNLDSTKDLPPSPNVNPLSGSTTSSSPSLTTSEISDYSLEEFADKLALIESFPSGNDDMTPEDVIRETEYFLNRDPLYSPNNDHIYTIPEMFTDEHTLDYSSHPRYDDADDDLFYLKTDNDEWGKIFYDDPFDSNENKIKVSKLLVDELESTGSSSFLTHFLEGDSVLYEDFFEVDTLTSTDNEDKVFNPGTLVHENLYEVTNRVTPDKEVKNISSSNTSLILEDYNPPLSDHELPFHIEIPGSGTLLSFSSKNEEKVFNPGILISKGVYSLLPKLSHRDSKAFKVINIFESPMEIFPCSYGEDIRVLDVQYYEASRARGFVLRSLELQS
ncbi:hypothetical protein Tco_0000359 [Tanacetum coccineum]